MLGQVATLELTGGPAVIDRYDRSRNINFEIELSGLPLGDVAALVGAAAGGPEAITRRADVSPNGGTGRHQYAGCAARTCARKPASRSQRRQSSS